MDLPEGRIRCRDGEAQLEVTDPSSSRQMVAEAVILAGAVTAELAEAGAAPALPEPTASGSSVKSRAGRLPDGAVRFATIVPLSQGLIERNPPPFQPGPAACVRATSPFVATATCLFNAGRRRVTPFGRATPGWSMRSMGSLREGIGIAREDQRHWQQVWFEGQKGKQ